MNNFSKNIFLLLTCLLILNINGFGQDGAWSGLDIGTLSCPSTYTNTSSTTGATSNCTSETSEDHMYQFTLSAGADVDITLCDPITDFDTKLYLFNLANGGCGSGEIAYNDDDASCASTTRSTLATQSLTAGTYVVLVEGWSGADGNYKLTIAVSNCLTCTDPSAQTTSGIIPTSANLGWTENGTASTWDIELGAAGFSPTGTPTSNNVTLNPYTHTGLTPSTSYDFYVRADCGGLQSNWIGPKNFSTTACNIQTPSSLTSTPGSTSANLSWIENGNAVTWDIAVGIVGFSPVGPTGNGNDVSLNTNFNYSGGLAMSTTYEWYVRSVCNGANGSWSAMGTFTTLSVTIESFVEKMSPSAWDDKANGVVYDNSDDSYIYAGNTSDASFSAGGEDFYVVKTDIEGTLSWAKVFGSSGTDKAFAVETTHDGGYVILGHTNSASYLTAGSDAGDYDMMLTKLNSAGSHVWTKVFGTDENDLNEDCSIMRTTDNGFVIVGQAARWTTGSKHVIHFYKLDASGNLIATKELEPTSGNTNGANAIIQTSDGGFAIAGHANYDHYVAKLNSDFTYDWSIKWTGGSGYEEIESIVENASDDYTVFGTTDAEGPGTTLDNMYAMRFTFDGTGSPTMSWAKTIGTGGASDNFYDACYGAVSSGDGGYVMSGFTDVADDDKYDSYIVKLNGSGNLVWETLIESGGTAWNDRRQARDIVMDAYGGFAIANKGFYGFEMIRLDPSGANCLSSAHTGLVTNLSAPTFTVNPGTYSASSSRTMTSVSRTPTFTSGGTVTQECIILPVSIASINTNCNYDHVQINWQTSSEVNNDYFTIEGSTDGILFSTIGTVQGAGNSNTNVDYFFVNKESLEYSYYRLKQTDFDGKYSYSKIIASNCTTQTTTVSSIFPNPAKNQLILVYNDSILANQNLALNIINPLGEIVLAKNYKSESHLKKTIDISDLPNGVYHVIISSSKHKEVHKLIISK